MQLPSSVQEIADVIGRDRALYLIGQLPTWADKRKDKGCTRPIIYVPKRLKPDHPLVRVLGISQAEQLVSAFGGEVLQPGNCNSVYTAFRQREVERYVREGKLTPREIAEIVGITASRVRTIAAQIPHEEIKPANDNGERHK